MPGVAGGVSTNGSYIRLSEDHPPGHEANGLLLSLGGRRFLPAEGPVYWFESAPARDEALGLLRGQMGSTVASPFDGHPRIMGAPVAC
jgi:hypothetical protein